MPTPVEPTPTPTLNMYRCPEEVRYLITVDQNCVRSFNSYHDYWSSVKSHRWQLLPIRSTGVDDHVKHGGARYDTSSRAMT
jgi:hypothetical protein